MKARAIVGKRIAKVHQRLADTNGGRRWVLDEIEFTDGSRLAFVVCETDRGEYEIEPTVYAVRKAPDV